MRKISVIVIGYGNSIYNLQNFLELIKERRYEDVLIWHKKVGGYNAEDIDLKAFFEIDCTKIDMFRDKIPIYRGILLDEAEFLRKAINDLCVSDPREFREIIRSIDPDVAVLAINSGEEKTSREYARILSEESISLINMTPEKLVNNDTLRRSFISKGSLIVGDDLMSHAGGTILHRYLVRFFTERGLKVIKSYQLDVSGTLETFVTLDEKIRSLKRDVKSRSIEFEGVEKVVAGTTDYIPFLKDQRISHIYMEIEAPMKKIFRLEVKYWSYDGVNAINTLIDVIRAVKTSEDENSKDPVSLERDIEIISAYGFKYPPKLMNIDESIKKFEERFIYSYK